MLQDQNHKPIEEIREPPAIEEMENLVGFFELLIATDRRLNPELYD